MTGTNDQDPPAFLIGDRDGDRLVIEVQGRAHPGADDYWDGNWLATPIDLRVQGFSASLPAQLRTDELRRFREGLGYINHWMKDGAAVLSSLDHWIELTIKPKDELGHLSVTGLASSLHHDVELRFELHDMNLSHLPPMIDALSAIEDLYPVLGQPN